MRPVVRTRAALQWLHELQTVAHVKPLRSYLDAYAHHQTKSRLFNETTLESKHCVGLALVKLSGMERPVVNVLTVAALAPHVSPGT